jgi:hypothetical protein
MTFEEFVHEVLVYAGWPYNAERGPTDHQKECEAFLANKECCLTKSHSLAFLWKVLDPKTCDTCRWWNYQGWRYGGEKANVEAGFCDCPKLEVLTDKCAEQGLNVTDHEAMGEYNIPPLSIQTAKDFGCIHHEVEEVTEE